MKTEIIRNGQTIVLPDGEIDLSNVDQFSTALNEAADGAPGGFIVDLSNTEYIDSAGIQAILAAYQRVRQAGGEIWLVLGNELIRPVVSVVNLGALPGMHVADDLDSAKRLLSSGG